MLSVTNGSDESIRVLEDVIMKEETDEGFKVRGDAVRPLCGPDQDRSYGRGHLSGS